MEHPIRQIRLPSQFGNDKSCVFAIKQFERHGKQFPLTENVNLNHGRNHYVYKNHYYVSKKSEVIESIYDAHSPLIVDLTIAVITL